MAKLYLGLALHNHQPIGNFDFVFEQAYKQAYLPMLEALERHSHVRVSLHYSGPLIDWLLENRPEFLDRLGALVARGQAEMMTGGYYEPILPMIPDADKIGQIRKLSDWLRERFGREPSGLWLTERVWEPYLPAPLSDAGVRWAILDDTHFKLAGLSDEELTGSYVTEEQGKRIQVFASSLDMRYAVPWHEVEKVIAYLRGKAGDEGEGRIVVMGDDGEKFGSWPTTYEYCWRNRWVERFFEALERERAWLETIPLGEYASRFAPRGIVYMPTASYEEMMEWSLPAEASAELHKLRKRLETEKRVEILRHLGGGFWRGFLRKYPEANAMHKRMLRVHEKAHRAGNVEALDLLWRGQCNCPYWHGVFGGLYLNHIRTANLSNLVAAERVADQALHDGRWGERATGDFDFDGEPEALLQSGELSIMVAPHMGGALKEWDLRGRDWALVGALARRREAYHESIRIGAKADGEGYAGEARSIHDEPRATPEILEALVYDRRLRLASQEQVLRAETGAKEYGREAYEPLLDLARVELSVADRDDGACGAIRLAGEGRIEAGEGVIVVGIEKSFELAAGGELRMGLRLRHVEGPPLRAKLASDWNVNLPGGEPSMQDGGAAFGIANEAMTLRAIAEPEAVVWHFPVRTVSNSDSGIEQVTQGHCVTAVWPVELERGGEASFSLRWRGS